MKRDTEMKGNRFPSTRFQGSKLKIVDWIWDLIKDLPFKTVLDAFGGTGSVAYLLKEKGKKVTYNDILKFNWYIGAALIENDAVKLTDADVEHLLAMHRGVNYPTFVFDTFNNIYFTDSENQWIDMVVTNIEMLDNFYKKAIGYFALFQSCISKRPFNLFHRKNLYLRLSNVQRNFGNKVTWDTPFEILFRKFVKEANRAVFFNNQANKSLNLDVFAIEGKFDLVYIDTPYISQRGIGTDYLNYYHFLEGLVNYSKWNKMIDYRTKHRCLKAPSAWYNKTQIYHSFDKLFEKFKDSILVVSYRSNGIPSIEELKDLLKKHKRFIHEYHRENYKYALSNQNCDEVILIGE